MKSGEILKNNLGLLNFKHVQIARLIVSPLPVYLIVFDSKRPMIPITTNRIKNNKKIVAMLFAGIDVQHNDSGSFYDIIPMITPLKPIEMFGGNISGCYFMTIDLGGQQLVNDNMLEGYRYYGRLTEITLFDLKQADITSKLTQKFKRIRKNLNKTANFNTKLISCELVDNDKSILFKFLDEATSNDDLYKKQVNPNTFELEPNPSKTYEVWMKFPNAVELLDLQDKTTIDRFTVKNLIEASDVQIWDNNPSWQYQGFNYWNSQLSSSIFPTNIPAKIWKSKHGDGQAFLTKHLSQLIDQISFFLNPMASMLDKVLREKGLLPKK